MPRTRKLSWFKARKCYRKMYHGKTYYLKSPCKNKTDEDGYQASEYEWQALKQFLDGFGPDPYVNKAWNPDDYRIRLGKWLINREPEVFPFGGTADQSQQPTSSPSPANPSATVASFSRYPQLNFSQPPARKAENKDFLLAELVDTFIQARVNDVKSNSITAKAFSQDRAKLHDFVEFANHYKKEHVSEIDSQFLTFYRQSQQLLIAKNDEHKISAETAKKRLQTVKKLWTWSYRLEIVSNIPKVLDTEFSKISIPRPEPKFWTHDEVVLLFKNASPRTKLYIALALNFGYTQSEIATLTWEMIDEKSMTVRRDRPKTDQPQVHSIWPVTLQLLKQESKSSKGLCLVGQKGNSLLKQEINDELKLSHNDTIRLAFNRTMKKAGLEDSGRTFKNLRKSAAQELLIQFEDNRIVDLFLAHSSKKDVRIHYVSQENARKKYFEAIDWLGNKYNLASLL